jgi:hypothetical protein
LSFEEIKKELWSRRGIEYKLERISTDGLKGTFTHAPMKGTPGPHTFNAKISDVLNTSYICNKCDKTTASRGEGRIRTILNDKNISMKEISSKGKPIFWTTMNGKKVAIAYMDRTYYINVVEENEKARKLRWIMEKNFDHPIILTHLEYKNLKKNLLRGLKEVYGRVDI